MIGTLGQAHCIGGSERRVSSCSCFGQIHQPLFWVIFLGATRMGKGASLGDRALVVLVLNNVLILVLHDLQVCFCRIVTKWAYLRTGAYILGGNYRENPSIWLILLL